MKLKIKRESIVEKKVIEFAKKSNCIIFEKLRQRGVPDRLILTPKGTYLFIEFKRENVSKPDPHQCIIINKIRKNNGLVFLINNIEEGIELINKFI